uniref:beta-galactoside alpha-(2,6)-sialyltransferase n=1 Tax=Prasinoderma singulare TaxID=676789 RepID=A0A7S3FGD8_9VIRI|mmetsp:Transcript_4290/g.13365  ORF Transcript_4290/g.13365 Transcript_4290/m.13365 type:complete len:297 (+) Transcript_4290:240-1130(+)
MRAPRGGGWPFAAMLVAVAVLGLLAFAAAQAQRLQGGVERFRGSFSGERKHCGSCGHRVSVRGVTPEGAPMLETPSFGSCAVVFPSGLLLNFSFGDEIDAHDAVFRMNRHFTGDYARYIGNKQTVRLVNSQHNGEKKESFLDFTRPEEVVFLRDWNSKMSRADWTRKSKFHVFETYEKVRRTHPGRPVFILSRELMRAALDCNQPFKRAGATPTSGFLSLILARQMCSKITLYGAGCHSCGYFAPNGPNATSTAFKASWHDTRGEMEAMLYMTGLDKEELVRRGKAEVDGCQTVTQ